jgi:hypothetical protein
MATDKPAYKVTIKLEGVNPELISEAMGELRERASEYDQIVAAQATLTIESWKEAPLRSIIDWN